MRGYTYVRAAGGPWTFRGKPIAVQPEGFIPEATEQNLPDYLAELGAARGEPGPWAEGVWYYGSNVADVPGAPRRTGVLARSPGQAAGCSPVRWRRNAAGVAEAQHKYVNLMDPPARRADEADAPWVWAQNAQLGEALFQNPEGFTR